MHEDAKIYVAGHRGLVGSAILRKLEEAGYNNLVVRTHAELDLTDSATTRAFFERERPEYVFMCAARVGGIMANSTYPAEFIYTNIAIGTNVIHESWRTGVKRLVFLGSSCIYPKLCPQPMKEEYLLTGPLESTNRPYALAKIAGIEMCWAYNRQYNTKYLSVMPTNLYGPGDNYDLQTSHVLPALIRKMHEAKIFRHPKVELWGTGTSRREFLYSGDLAEALLFLMNLDEEQYTDTTGDEEWPPLINIGSGTDVTIRELAELIQRIVGYGGDIVWDASKPDGTPRKLLDVSRLNSLGWKYRTGLNEGIQKQYQNFVAGIR
ncbi:MAG: GDP-L-fucose synthase family protein [Candidatus Latescibacterota bacterium]